MEAATARGLVPLLTMLAALISVAHQRDVRRARKRARAGSQTVGTARGSIEYADIGEGQPVLVVHGAGGGVDQGLAFSTGFAQSGFRVITMSRFGYLRTPLPADASPAAQAEAHACLLDALHIRRVAVVAASAGAPSAMQFALRYPDRTAALVLVVPAAYPARIEQRSQGAMPMHASAMSALLFDLALRSNFLFWVAARLLPQAITEVMLGTPTAVVARAGADERARVAQVLDHLQPLSARRLGLHNDAAITPFLPRYELERIAAPTLVVGVADDLYGTYAGARYSAAHIPGARLISYPTGGHVWAGHHKEAMAEIEEFLHERYSP